MDCKICGKPSGFFPLCKDCNLLKEQGKIVKCDKCNEWYYSDKKCKCKAKCQNNCNCTHKYLFHLKILSFIIFFT